MPLQLFALPFLTTACNIKDTINYRNTLLRFTDVHIDVRQWENMPSAAQTHMASQLPFPDVFDAEDILNELYSSEGIIREMNAAGIDRGILFSTHSPAISGVIATETILERIENGEERLWGLASVNTDLWAVNETQAISTLEANLSHDAILGVALSPSHQRFRMDDPIYWSIYEKAAEFNAPVFVQTGSSTFTGAFQGSAYTSPNALEFAIEANPDTSFVLSGLGFDRIEASHNGLGDCLRMARDYDNVWLEAGSIGSPRFDPDGVVIEQTAKLIKEAELIDRFLFGTGGSVPSGSADATVDSVIEAFMGADYTYDEALSVFSANAESLFGLSPSVWP